MSSLPTSITGGDTGHVGHHEELHGRTDGLLTVTQFGAKGDGSTDDTSAIQAAIDAVKSAAGGELIVPPGEYRAGALDMDGLADAIVRGQDAEFVCTSATGTFASVTNAKNCHFDDIRWSHEASGFSGTLVDCTQSSDITFARCQFGGVAGAPEDALCLDIDSSHTIYLDWCKFEFHDIAISGAKQGSFSTNIFVNNTKFSRGNTTHVRNGGNIWTFSECSFSNHTGGHGGAYGQHEHDDTPDSITFVGCWFGDVTSGTRAQIEQNSWNLTVVGGVLGIGPGTGIEVVASDTRGLNVLGTRIRGDASASATGIEWPASGQHFGAVVLASFAGVTNNYVNRPTSGVFGGAEFEINGVTFSFDGSQIQRSGSSLRIGTGSSDPFIVETNGTECARWTTGGALLQTVQDVEVGEQDRGLIAKSPDGTKWRLTPDNSGNSVWTSL